MKNIHKMSSSVIQFRWQQIVTIILMRRPHSVKPIVQTVGLPHVNALIKLLSINPHEVLTSYGLVTNKRAEVSHRHVPCIRWTGCTVESRT